MIPYGKHNISNSDIEAVIEVLKSDSLTQGKKVPEFESKVASYCNVEYAVAANSATSCLHIACLALGLSEGDHLWTSPNSFVASSNCALYCGANVDFVDIDRKTYNMCPDKLEQKLKKSKEKGTLPKIVIPVHFAGQAPDLQSISKLAQEYNFKIIEDASHAIGGEYLNKKIGNCEFSDISVFSFHPVKIITTGEGGIATTKNKELANKLSLLRTHGITKDIKIKDDLNSWLYEQQDLGFNYRLSDIHAALGVSQLERLDSFVKRRHEILLTYEENLKVQNVTLPFQSEDSYSSLHLFPIELRLENLSKSKEEIFHQLRNEGLGVNVHYIPIHMQPFYKNLGFKKGDFPDSEDYYKRTITLPMYPSMEEKEIFKVISVLETVVY